MKCNEDSAHYTGWLKKRGQCIFLLIIFGILKQQFMSNTVLNNFILIFTTGRE